MDSYSTDTGPLKIEHLGHASLRMSWQGYSLYVDPYSEVAAFDQLPQADLILITHEHFDHFDPPALSPLRKTTTTLIAPQRVARQYDPVTPLNNGEQTQWKQIGITATPAYNRLAMRSPGVPFHIPGEGNGYLLEINPLRIYVAGDTELIPEMRQLGKVDIAFLPKNIPYTMSDEMFIEAARIIRPAVLYPYHYDTLNVEQLRSALPGITLR